MTFSNSNLEKNPFVIIHRDREKENIKKVIDVINKTKSDSEHIQDNSIKNKNSFLHLGKDRLNVLLINEEIEDEENFDRNKFISYVFNMQYIFKFLKDDY